MSIRVLTTKAAAEALSCSPGTVRRLCDTGKLRFTRLNGEQRGHRRIYVESVDEFLGIPVARKSSRRAEIDEARAVMAELGIQRRYGVEHP